MFFYCLCGSVANKSSADYNSLIINMTRKNILVIFSRYPKPGESKTRLIPAIGSEKAAMLQRHMTEDTVLKARKLASLLGIEVKIFYTGGSQLEMQTWLGDFHFEKQVDGDLGNKMAAAFDQTFLENGAKVVIVGTDCPDLEINNLQKAFSMLNVSDLVLGPAIDGGYYLIGLNKEASFLFKDMPWGSTTVFSETKRRAQEKKMKISCLKTLADIDRPQDLHRLVLSREGINL